MSSQQFLYGLCVFAVCLSVFLVQANARFQLGKYGLTRYPAYGATLQNVQTQDSYMQGTYPTLQMMTPVYQGFSNVFQSQRGREMEDSIIPQTMVSRDMENMMNTMMTSQELIEFQMSMLELQNKLRATVGLKPLQWSPELAEFALNHMMTTEANTGTCAMQHSSNAARQVVGPFSNVGENLFVSARDIPAAEDVVSTWYNQGICYRYNSFGDQCTMTLAVSPQQQCNPAATIAKYFTQLMWSTTTHVGCAIHRCSTCTTNDCPQYAVGCNYGSTVVPYGGNVVGSTPFDQTVAERLNIPVCVNSEVQDRFSASRRFLQYNDLVQSPMMAQTVVDPVTGYPLVMRITSQQVGGRVSGVPSSLNVASTYMDTATSVPNTRVVVDPLTGVPTATMTMNGVPTATMTMNGVPTATMTMNGVPTSTMTMNGVPTSTMTMNRVPTSMMTMNGVPTMMTMNGVPTMMTMNGVPTTMTMNGVPTTMTMNGVPTTMTMNGVPTTMTMNGVPTTTIPVDQMTMLRNYVNTVPFESRPITNVAPAVFNGVAGVPVTVVNPVTGIPMTIRMQTMNPLYTSVDRVVSSVPMTSDMQTMAPVYNTVNRLPMSSVMPTMMANDFAVNRLPMTSAMPTMMANDFNRLPMTSVMPTMMANDFETTAQLIPRAVGQVVDSVTGMPTMVQQSTLGQVPATVYNNMLSRTGVPMTVVDPVTGMPVTVDQVTGLPITVPSMTPIYDNTMAQVAPMMQTVDNTTTNTPRIMSVPMFKRMTPMTTTLPLTRMRMMAMGNRVMMAPRTSSVPFMDETTEIRPQTTPMETSTPVMTQMPINTMQQQIYV